MIFQSAVSVMLNYCTCEYRFHNVTKISEKCFSEGQKSYLGNDYSIEL